MSSTSCIICLQHVNRTSSGDDQSSSKVQPGTRKKFWGFVCRYVNLDFDLVQSKNSDGNDQESEEHQVCAVCFTTVEAFCELHNLWQLLQLKMTWTLAQIEDMIRKSEKESLYGPKTTGADNFRKKLTARIKKRRMESNPRVEIENVTKTEIQSALGSLYSSPNQTFSATNCEDEVKQEVMKVEQDPLSLSLLDSAAPDTDVENPEADHGSEPPSFEPEKTEYCSPTPLRKGFRRSKPGTIHKCPICLKLCRTPSKLESHMLTHTGERPFKCRYCDKRMSARGDMKKHERTHTGDKPYQCKYCGRCFTRADQCTKHEKSIHTNDKSRRKRGPTGGVIGSITNKDGDRNENATEDWRFMCKFCGKCFGTQHNLHSHEKRHVEKHICKICKKEFGALQILSNHERIHTGENSRQCRFCPRKFVHLGSLQIHERTHTGEKPYKCDSCGKGFSDKSGLTEHKRRHNKERPYKCNFCQKGFPCAGDLKRHLNIHTGEKFYNCSFCDKRCGQKDALKRHELTHTGEKRFECHFCHKRFPVVPELNRHVRRIHAHENDNTGEKVNSKETSSKEVNDQRKPLDPSEIT